MKHSDINWPHLITLGRQLVGKPYVFGAEVNLRDPDPAHITAIDCSELVEWLYAQIGISVPDGSYNQAKVCRRLEREAPVLIGDLGFKWNPDTEIIHHVGIYIGDDTVLEAKGKAWGVTLSMLSSYVASNHFAFWGRLKTVEDA